MLVNFAIPASVAASRRLRRCDRIGYAITLIGFCMLALTGFIGWFGLGRLSGWLLLAHVSAAPFFVVGLTALTVTLAERCRFRASAKRTHDEDTPAPAAALPVLHKAVFWAVVVLGLVSVASVMVARLPVFGYTTQKTLADIHRYSGLGLLCTAVMHACLLLPPRRQEVDEI